MAHGTWYQTGGDWTYLKSIEKLYANRGVKIIPYSMVDSRNEYTKYEKYFVSNVDYSSTKLDVKNIKNVISRAIYSSESVYKITKLLEENEIDVVQLNSIHNIHTLSIIPAIKKFNKPLFWRVLDYKILCPNRTFLSNGEICKKCLKGNFSWASIKRCKRGSFPASIIASLEAYFNSNKGYLDMVDTFLLQSQFSKDLFIEAGFSRDKLKVIKNPYETSKDQKFIQSNDDDKYILYFGRISEEKGIETLVEAMKSIKNVSLKIVGDGPHLKYLINLVEEMNLKNITFLGPVWGTELDNIIKKAKLTVLPSEWFEVSPYAILQSFENGIPVVGSNIGGIPDLIKEDYNGMLFKPGSPNHLIAAVEKILHNSEICYAKNCKDYLRLNHHPDLYFKSTTELFKTFI